MRILHISWEYPPLVYGGLGRHVHALAEAQAKLGHRVTVLTQQGPGAPARERLNGVDVVRVTPPTPEVPRDPHELVSWVEQLDGRMADVGDHLVTAVDPEVIHAHDWVVARAAAQARRGCSAPLVVTVHATEAGRHQGWISNDLSRTVHGVECRLTNQAQRVITCSNAMRTEVSTLFDVPVDRIDVIPNGIDLARWHADPAGRADARATWARDGALLVFVGRLEWEKGVHTLLAAAAALADSSEHPFHLVVAGTGTYEAALREQARELSDRGLVTFTGWIPEKQLRDLTAAADVAVVPSLYEPFGLVALEAGALGAPLVVARSGGLADIVTDGITGRVFTPGQPLALAAAIDDLLDAPGQAAAMAHALHEQLGARYDWTTIAETTVETYQLAGLQNSQEPRPQNPKSPPTIPAHNLLTGALD